MPFYKKWGGAVSIDDPIYRNSRDIDRDKTESTSLVFINNSNLGLNLTPGGTHVWLSMDVFHNLYHQYRSALDIFVWGMELRSRRARTPLPSLTGALSSTFSLPLIYRRRHSHYHQLEHYIFHCDTKRVLFRFSKTLIAFGVSA